MPSRLLQEAQAGSWLIALFTAKYIKAKHQLQALATMLKFERELKFYQEAMESLNRIHWWVAMEEKYKALINNKTWIFVKWTDVPPGCRVLTRKWTYKVKTLLEPDSSELYKAH